MENRLSGLFVLLFSFVVFFVLIPQQVEIIDEGWLHPSTLPIIATFILAIAGGVHLAFPRGEAGLNIADSFRALILLGTGVAGLCAMHFFGFIIAAPLLMLAVMLRLGERRWLWLLIGVVLLPGFIWICIDILLKRPLP